MSRQKSGEGYQNMSAALTVPKTIVASIIFQWKKFGTSETVARVGLPTTLSNRGRWVLVREVNKNTMVTLTEVQSSSVEMGEPSRRTTISAALYKSGLLSSLGCNPVNGIDMTTASESAGSQIQNNRNLKIKIPQTYKYYIPFKRSS